MKIGVIFPGYSNQYVGMGKELYDEFRIIQEYFEEAYNCLNNNFIKLCFASSDIELSKTTNAYTSIFLVGSSLFSLLREQGIQPSIMAGHGIGSFTAIFASGVFSFPDGLYLLTKYASFYEETLANLNADVLKIDNISNLKIKKMLKGTLQIAISNNKFQSLVSGDKEEINSLKEEIKHEYKIKAQRIDPSIGLYSDLMNNVAKQFKIYLEKVDFKDANIPLVSSIDGKELLIGKKIKSYIIKQISSSFNWNKIMDKFKDIDLIIEVGPGNSLSELMKEKYPSKKIISLNKKTDFDEIKRFIFNKNQEMNEQLNSNIIKDINVEQLEQ